MRLCVTEVTVFTKTRDHNYAKTKLRQLTRHFGGSTCFLRNWDIRQFPNQLNKYQGSRKQQHKIWKITKSQRVDAPQPHTLPNPNPSNPCRCYYCLRGLGQNPMAWLEPLPATPVTGRTQGLLDLAFCWALHRASSPEPADHHVPSFRTCCFRQ